MTQPKFGGIKVEKNFIGLLETMQQQLDLYRKLTNLAQEKQLVLLKSNVSELERLTKEEEIFIMRVGKLEERRLVFHQALANHFALSIEELPLSELIRRTDKDNHPHLQRLSTEITDVLKKLAEINETNSDLIKSSLEYVNWSINLLTSVNTNSFYNEVDEEKMRTAARVFDKQV